MHSRLKRILAVWFVVQIVLPFTAPLQTFDLTGLLGATHKHDVPASPESSTTPTESRANAAVNAFVSPLAVSTVCASTSLAVVPQLTVSSLLIVTFDLSPSPQVQPAVLRV
jgi:hypothetical protein